MQQLSVIVAVKLFANSKVEDPLHFPSHAALQQAAFVATWLDRRVCW
jgi:hypothetical protein